MNDAAPRFFRMIQDDLVDAIVLRIGRLTDPPKSAGKSNLTIRQLQSRIQDQQLLKQVSKLVDAAVKTAQPCRTRRHTRIAHNALDLALGVHNQPLPSLTRDNIGKAIEGLASVLNAISSHYLKSTTQFDIGSNPGGARALIRVLEDGVQKKTQRIAEMKLNAKNWNVPRAS
jgi:AbiU2